MAIVDFCRYCKKSFGWSVTHWCEEKNAAQTSRLEKNLTKGKEMKSELEKIGDDLAVKLAVDFYDADYHGQHPSIEELVRQGFDACLKHLTEVGMGEFDEDALDKWKDGMDFCTNVEAARWQHKQNAALIGALISGRDYFGEQCVLLKAELEKNLRYNEKVTELKAQLAEKTESSLFWMRTRATDLDAANARIAEVEKELAEAKEDAKNGNEQWNFWASEHAKLQKEVAESHPSNFARYQRDQAEIKRLRSALEFYANEKNWDDRIIKDTDGEATKLHVSCGGRKARQALAGPGGRNG